jgi:hypothetical protein
MVICRVFVALVELKDPEVACSKQHGINDEELASLLQRTSMCHNPTANGIQRFSIFHDQSCSC